MARKAARKIKTVFGWAIVHEGNEYPVVSLIRGSKARLRSDYGFRLKQSEIIRVKIIHVRNSRAKV